MVHHFFGTDPEPVAASTGGSCAGVRRTSGVRKLRDFARVVRAAGFEASVNHVAPLGPVVKAGTGPEQTSMGSPPPFGGRVESAGPRVAVIDTGITSQVRPDGWLSGVERREGSNIDGLTLLPSPEDRFLDFAAGHGTFAAGIVAQVAPAAEVAAYAAVDTDGIGSEVCIGEAMVEAAREGASILNLSLGGPTLDNQPLLAIEVALDIINEIERDEQREILVVAAAGNDGVKRPCWPPPRGASCPSPR
jgi:hypothetical protein